MKNMKEYIHAWAAVLAEEHNIACPQAKKQEYQARANNISTPLLRNSFADSGRQEGRRPSPDTTTSHLVQSAKIKAAEDCI